MRTLILAAIAAATLVAAASAPAYAYGCKYIWVNGKYVNVCDPKF
jgi:hypothetical protein